MDNELKIQKQFSDYLCSGAQEIVELINPHHLSRISIYKNNFQLNGEETLSQVFPVTRMVLGRQFFDFTKPYIESFIADSPSRNEWGNEFPEFIEHRVRDSDLEFIADLTKLELHLFEASIAVSSESLSIHDLQNRSAEINGFTLIPSVSLMTSSFRVDLLYDAHVGGKINEHPNYKIQMEPCSLVIFQKDNEPIYAALDSGIFNFIKTIKESGWNESEISHFGEKQLVKHLCASIELGIILA